MKQESVRLLQNILDGLIKKYNELLNDGKYNEALNVMKNVEMILRQLKELGVQAVSDKNNGIFLDWYNVLKFFIETKQPQLITLDYSSKDGESKHRSTGKTCALVRLANDFMVPIYTKNRYVSAVKDRAEELGLNPLIIDDISKLTLKQYENTNVILVDEITNIDSIDKDRYCVIGFKTSFNT